MNDCGYKKQETRHALSSKYSRHALQTYSYKQIRSNVITD